MTRTKWFGLLSSLIVILSMGFASVATPTHAAGAKASKAKKSSIPVRCKTRIKAKGTIKYSDWQFPDTLNSYQTTEAVSTETLNAMFDGLYTYNSQAHVIPQIATRVPTTKNGLVKNGGKTIIINIKKGLQWSNGAEITSKDIWMGWKVGMEKATGPACSGSCDIITRIDTPNKYQAVLHLKQIYAPAIPYAIPGMWPTAWKNGWKANDYVTAAQKLGQDNTFNFENSSYPTNGPYQVASFVKDDRIVLHPMKYYSDMTCGGAISNLIFAFYSDKPGMIAAAASKQTDVTQDYTPADLPELRKHTDAYTLHSDPGFIFEHLEFNVDKTYNGNTNPLSNTNVRLALALALDKVGLIRSALGVTTKLANQVIGWTPWVNTPGLVQPYADKAIRGQWDPMQKKYVVSGTSKALADAKKLLAKTPFGSGFTLDFDTTTGNAVRAAQAAVVQNSWSKIGVKLNLNLVPATKLFGGWDSGGTLDHGQYQVAMFAFLGQPDPDQLKYNLQSKYIDREASTHASINENYSGVHDSLFDKQFNIGAHSFTPSVRNKAYAAIQVEINKQAYWVPLYFRPTIATNDSKVLGFQNNPTQFGPTINVYNWRSKTG